MVIGSGFVYDEFMGMRFLCCGVNLLESLWPKSLITGQYFVDSICAIPLSFATAQFINFVEPITISMLEKSLIISSGITALGNTVIN